MKKYLLTLLAILFYFNGFAIEPIALEKIKIRDGEWFHYAKNDELRVEVAIKAKGECNLYDYSTDSFETPIYTREDQYHGCTIYYFYFKKYNVAHATGFDGCKPINSVMFYKRPEEQK